MSLQAKDLMIGDLLTFEDCVKDGKIIPIEVVELHGYNNDFLASIDGDKSCDMLEFDDEIVGIPLTPEILEKNGFRKRPYPNVEKHHQWIFCAGCTITLWCCRLFDNADEGWMIDIDDAFCHSCRVHIKHLHELQHALKLCKIDKEIKLWN